MKNSAYKSVLEFSVCVFTASLLLSQVPCVTSQCQRPDGIPCAWDHLESRLRWVYNAEKNAVELTKCVHPNCGSGIIASPWMSKSSAEKTMTLDYMIYGHGETSLKLNLKTGNTEIQLFLIYGNYEDPFPKDWTSKEIVIPATGGVSQLILKANISYKDAYVAVRDIRLGGNIVLITPDPLDEDPDTETEYHTTTEEYVEELPETEEEETKPETNNNVDEIEMTERLERPFSGVEELSSGRTTVVNPNLCKYK